MKASFCTIDELKADVRYSCVGGPFGSNLTQRDYRDDGVPVIRGANLPNDQEFLDDAFVFVSDQKADALAANTAYPGDLVFTQRGTLGQIGIIPFDSEHPRYIISQSQMKLTVDTAKANPKYVYYFFRQKHIAEMIRRRAITSGVPHINLGILKSMTVLLNARPVQDAIVAVVDNEPLAPLVSMADKQGRGVITFDKANSGRRLAGVEDFSKSAHRLEVEFRLLPRGRSEEVLRHDKIGSIGVRNTLGRCRIAWSKFFCPTDECLAAMVAPMPQFVRD